MRIKINSKPSGLPEAKVTVSDGEDDMGARWIVVHISALDNHDMPTMAATLRLSPEEAADLSTRLCSKVIGR